MFKKKDGQDKKNNSEDIELVSLRTVNNEFELNIIKALLDDNKIPYIVKDTGIGGYMRVISGTSLYGTHVLVEESMYEMAVNVLKGISMEEE